MNWFKNFTNTPFSDLWLPSILIGLGLISVLALHWLWLQWRVSRLEANSKNAILNAAAQAGADTNTLNQPLSGSSQYSGLSDIHAFTAQKQAVYIEDLDVPVHKPANREPVFSSEYFDTKEAPSSSRIAPSFGLPTAGNNASDSTSNFVQRSAVSSGELRAQIDTQLNNVDPDNTEGDIFFNPHATVLQAKKNAQPLLTAHPQLHYQARFTWGDSNGKQVLNDVLAAHSWPHAMPVIWLADTHNDCSVLAAWQVANRRELANAEQADAFKQWCETIASLGGARFELLSPSPWESFLDEAHSLLIGLDSVIVLKVSVPLVQLDLFAQSLLAARFTQSQEHWVYQESTYSASICLERLWQQNAANSAINNGSQNLHTQSTQPIQQAAEAAQNNAIFQLIIDIPHMDSLEARKVYMRLRAVARASAAILQSAQGAHLSEGMLDRYSRELLLKQEALSKADIAPGSQLAKQVFKPHLRTHTDLEL